MTILELNTTTIITIFVITLFAITIFFVLLAVYNSGEAMKQYTKEKWEKKVKEELNRSKIKLSKNEKNN